jgi:hypothetical protein
MRSSGGHVKFAMAVKSKLNSESGKHSQNTMYDRRDDDDLLQEQMLLEHVLWPYPKILLTK